MQREAQANVILYGWPSDYGGAATKVASLIPILAEFCHLTLVPSEWFRLRETRWRRFLDRHGVRCCLERDLPSRIKGVALAICQERFFVDDIALRAKERGLRLVWSPEMTWPFEGELEAAQKGLIDAVLYVSKFQERKLRPNHAGVPGFLVGNYIDPFDFPLCQRTSGQLTLGRLSRADATKYAEDFPAFYEALNIPAPRYRVMAWNDRLAEKYRWHQFGPEWDLLAYRAEPPARFLQSLDLFVYRPGHRCEESWGRSVIEAALSGCVPIVPKGHAFTELIDDGATGFLCEDVDEYKDACFRLARDRSSLNKMGRRARDEAERRFCDKKKHRRAWKAVVDAHF